MIGSALRLAALAALCGYGLFLTLRFLGAPDVGPRRGPHASSDQMLMVLGHQAPTAAVLELVESVPPDRPVTVVGYEPFLLPVGFTIASLSFPRPVLLVRCGPPDTISLPLLPFPARTADAALAFVYSGERVRPRAGYSTLTHRLLAVRRMRGVPPPRQLCHPDREPDPQDVVSRGRAALLVSRLLHGDGTAPPPARGLFDDLDRRSRQAAAVEELYGRGLVKGCGPRRYCPDDPMPRGAMSALVLAAAGAAPGEARGVFADAPAARFDAAAVERVHALGVPACAADPPRFCPDLPVTRGAAESFLAAAAAARDRR
jgi:hypothetical protein